MPEVPPGALSAEGITHRYGRTAVLDDVTFTVAPGEIHALLGENGAGKSTLVKILTGALRPTAGKLRVDGRALTLRSPGDALRHGIAVVHQDSQTFPDLTVAENICIGTTALRGGLSPAARADMRRRARVLLDGLAVGIDPNRPCGLLRAGERKIVEIARAVAQNSRYLLLDEPTASLEPRETDQLLALMQRLTATHGLVFVTHRLDEVRRVGSRATILRDGRVVHVAGAEEVAAADTLVRHILGHERRATPAPAPSANAGEVVLRVRVPGDADEGDRPEQLDFRSGHIYAATGLMGSGHTEFLRAIAGRDVPAGIDVRGEDLGRAGRGVGYIPENRRVENLFPELSIAHNMAIARLDRYRRFGLISHARLRQDAVASYGRFGVRGPGVAAPIAAFSGGNQQKALIARWIGSGVRILVVEEPTQGVDIGARAEIHVHLRAFAARGGTVFVASTDVDELMDVSDEVLVFYRNRLRARLTRSQLTPELLGQACSGLLTAEIS